MIYKLDDTKKAEKLFGNWQETMIWSCLQKVMGEIYVERLNAPRSAMALIGDFCALSGEPLKELVLFKPVAGKRDFLIMVPQNEQWSDLIASSYGDKAKKITRYALKKEAGIFDREKLQINVEQLPHDYELKMIDEKLYNKCRENTWSSDLVSLYPDYSMYKRLGLGAVILKNNEIVSGASAYTRYEKGIEIEVDTKKEYRQKGLAYICCSKLILECLKQDLYPSWDAHNRISVALAEKLGYHFSHEYTAFEIYDYES